MNIDYIQIEQEPKTSLVVSVDDLAATYIQHYHTHDVNTYITQLLRDEKTRYKTEKTFAKTNDILNATPDTSGYPDSIQQHQNR